MTRCQHLRFCSLLVLLAIVGGCAKSRNAESGMFAVTWSGDLLREDPNSGEYIELGRYKPGRLNSLAISEQGELFTVHSADYRLGESGQSLLLHIDSNTGQFEIVAALSERLDVRSLSFDYFGRLLAIANDGPPDKQVNTLLYEIDINTGRCTRIGATGRPMMQSLCLGPQGELYAYNGGFRRIADQWGLCTVDAQTARVNRVAMRGEIANVQSLAFDPDGRVLVVAPDDKEGSGRSALYVLNLQTGKFTLLRSFGEWDVRGIDFPPAARGNAAPPGSRFVARSWPEPVTVADAMRDTSRVEGVVRLLKYESTPIGSTRFGGARASLQIQYELSCGPLRPFPLAATSAKLLELRDQRGRELSSHVVDWTPEYSPGSRAYALWTRGPTISPGNPSGWSQDMNRAPNAYNTVFQSVVIPDGQLLRIEKMRSQVEVLLPIAVKTVHLSETEAGKSVELGNGYALKLASWFENDQSMTQVAKAVILSTDPGSTFQKDAAPLYVWRVTRLSPGAYQPNMECGVSSELTFEGVSLRITGSDPRPVLRRTPGAADAPQPPAEHPPDSLVFEIVTEVERQAVNFELSQVEF